MDFKFRNKKIDGELCANLCCDFVILIGAVRVVPRVRVVRLLLVQ